MLIKMTKQQKKIETRLKKKQQQKTKWLYYVNNKKY